MLSSYVSSGLRSPYFWQHKRGTTNWAGRRGQRAGCNLLQGVEDDMCAMEACNRFDGTGQVLTMACLKTDSVPARKVFKLHPLIFLKKWEWDWYFYQQCIPPQPRVFLMFLMGPLFFHPPFSLSESFICREGMWGSTGYAADACDRVDLMVGLLSPPSLGEVFGEAGFSKSFYLLSNA